MPSRGKKEAKVTNTKNEKTKRHSGPVNSQKENIMAQNENDNLNVSKRQFYAPTDASRHYVYVKSNSINEWLVFVYDSVNVNRIEPKSPVIRDIVAILLDEKEDYYIRALAARTLCGSCLRSAPIKEFILNSKDWGKIVDCALDVVGICNSSKAKEICKNQIEILQGEIAACYCLLLWKVIAIIWENL